MARPTTHRLKCSIVSCFNSVKAKDLCSKHYQRYLKYGDPIAGVRDQEPRRGQSRKATYWVWSAMIQRCTNPRHKEYPNYGERGIAVCPEWRISFAAFEKDMGPRPEGLTIERKDNDLDYSPDNCRWATPKEQNQNQRIRKDALIVTFQGRTDTLRNFCRDLDLKYTTAYYRIELQGWSVEKALALNKRPKPRPPQQIEYNGKLMNIRELSNLTGVKYATLWSRLARGWSVGRALCP